MTQKMYSRRHFFDLLLVITINDKVQSKEEIKCVLIAISAAVILQLEERLMFSSRLLLVIVERI